MWWANNGVNSAHEYEEWMHKPTKNAHNFSYFFAEVYFIIVSPHPALKYSMMKDRAVFKSKNMNVLKLFKLEVRGCECTQQIMKSQTSRILFSHVIFLRFIHFLCGVVVMLQKQSQHFVTYIYTSCASKKEKKKRERVAVPSMDLMLITAGLCILAWWIVYELPNWWIRQRKNWDHVYLIQSSFWLRMQSMQHFFLTRTQKGLGCWNDNVYEYPVESFVCVFFSTCI